MSVYCFCYRQTWKKKKKSRDEGKTAALDGWLSLGQRNVVARGRVVEEILLRMKFPLVLIIPLKAGRLLFFQPKRRAWMDRVCAGVESWALAKLKAKTGTKVIIHLWETFCSAVNPEWRLCSACAALPWLILQDESGLNFNASKAKHSKLTEKFQLSRINPHQFPYWVSHIDKPKGLFWLYFPKRKVEFEYKVIVLPRSIFVRYLTTSSRLCYHAKAIGNWQIPYWKCDYRTTTFISK